MILKINKKVILEEFELNPFKIYAKYKVNKDMEAMANGTKLAKENNPEIEKTIRESPGISTNGNSTNILDHTLNNIHNHNNAIDDAMKLLNH